MQSKAVKEEADSPMELKHAEKLKGSAKKRSHKKSTGVGSPPKKTCKVEPGSAGQLNSFGADSNYLAKLETTELKPPLETNR